MDNKEFQPNPTEKKIDQESEAMKARVMLESKPSVMKRWQFATVRGPSMPDGSISGHSWPAGKQHDHNTARIERAGDLPAPFFPVATAGRNALTKPIFTKLSKPAKRYWFLINIRIRTSFSLLLSNQCMALV